MPRFHWWGAGADACARAGSSEPANRLRTGLRFHCALRADPLCMSVGGSSSGKPKGASVAEHAPLLQTLFLVVQTYVLWSKTSAASVCGTRYSHTDIVHRMTSVHFASTYLFWTDTCTKQLMRLWVSHHFSCVIYILQWTCGEKLYIEMAVTAFCCLHHTFMVPDQLVLSCWCWTHFFEVKKTVWALGTGTRSVENGLKRAPT